MLKIADASQFLFKGFAWSMEGGRDPEGLLTFHPQWQLIADRLALVVDGTARIVPGIVLRNLLEYQALVRTDDPGGRVVFQMDSLEFMIGHV